MLCTAVTLDNAISLDNGVAMTDLEIRDVQFTFDGTVPFQWLPSHPKFGAMCNAISFLAISFERFIVRTTHEAMPLITDPEVASEAEAFLRQEAQHAGNHRRHVHALIRKYPGLKLTLNEAIGAFDDLVDTKPLEWRLAYTADLEATFTPIFKVMLDHEEILFRPGDERVASLFLWHFVEEVEHRSSALIIAGHLAPSRYYRTRVTRAVFRHVMTVYRNILRGFDEHVPEADRRAGYGSLSPAGMRREELILRLPLRQSWRSRLGVFPPATFAPASRAEMAALFARLLRSQWPYHDPAREPLPRFAAEWFARYDAGYDVTRYYTGGRKESRA